MNSMIELLASAREADLQRESDDRRLKELATACRRRLLGLLPPRASASC
jgi:hypothetical protein